MNNSKLCVFCVLGHSVVVVHDSCGTFRDWDMNSDVAMLDTFLVASNIKKRSSRERARTRLLLHCRVLYHRYIETRGCARFNLAVREASQNP
jgi:hypothetical protein